MRPVIGIACCRKAVGPYATLNHAASHTYIRAVLGPVGGAPVLIPAAGEDLSPALLPLLDGLILTGSRSNVWPGHYGGPPHPEGMAEDPARDATTLPLIRAALAAAIPLLAICRGMQELNVALGGDLDQRIQDLPGRLDHSTPADQPQQRLRIAKAHQVRIEAGGVLERLLTPPTRAAGRMNVNSLHHQAIRRLAPGLAAEAFAPDGTIEAVRVTTAKAFALGVQWHPEYDWEWDADSRAIFTAFGQAAAAHHAARSQGPNPALAAE